MKRILFLIIAINLSLTTWGMRSDSSIVDFLKKEYNVPFTQNNSVVFFHSGKEKYDDLLLALREAKESIHMEYFNFRNDSISREVFSVLKEKARRGVEVRVIIDYFGNRSNDKALGKEHLEDLRSCGIKLHIFDPIKFPWINHAFHRDHRKIVVIDGLIAYTGGMNVADYYIHGKPEFGNWIDLHMRVEGDAVAKLQSVFINFWNEITGEHLQGTQYYPGARKPSDYFLGLKQDTTHSANNTMIGVVNRDHRVAPDIIHDTFVYAIEHAQEQIQIVNPYFTLCHHIKRALKKAARRGVKVEIMISEKCDVGITPRVAENNVNQLMKVGADIYFYQNGFHHGKIMIVDGEYSFVGSANLNSRSLSYDYECNLLINDKEKARYLQKQFDQDKTNKCFLLTPEKWKDFPLKKRIGGKIFTILRPFL